MQYFVRELSDRRAQLIAEDGHPLSTFNCVDDAVATCIIDCRVAPMWIEWFATSSVQITDGDCIQHALARYLGTRRPGSATAIAS